MRDQSGTENLLTEDQKDFSIDLKRLRINKALTKWFTNSKPIALGCVILSRDWKGIIHYELLSPGKTINSDLYCQQLKRIMQVENKRLESINGNGSLLPVPDSDYKFLQIYFMGDSARQVDQRCAHNNSVKRPVVEQLQLFFHQYNALVALFKTALDDMPSDNHKIVIKADKTPAEQHRRFNAPTTDEVAIVIVGENVENRDIVLHRRNNHLILAR
ncbi:hypothetical protein EVAR_13856_1 [Eumeta japonica]|uniref:Uncharacterized protein n=1 Tax=Eumeta variegata TaxID=151549 RepID=A0A4C1U201_EUMVA|nr:hypothetical protein EVAR_13856_1 [Eumeta japonica]